MLEIVGRCKEEVWAFPAQLMNGSASVPGTGRTDYERFLGTWEEWWCRMGVESEMSITKVKREGKESSTWSTSNSKE